MVTEAIAGVGGVPSPVDTGVSSHGEEVALAASENAQPAVEPTATSLNDALLFNVAVVDVKGTGPGLSSVSQMPATHGIDAVVEKGFDTVANIEQNVSSWREVFVNLIGTPTPQPQTEVAPLDPVAMANATPQERNAMQTQYLGQLVQRFEESSVLMSQRSAELNAVMMVGHEKMAQQSFVTSLSKGAIDSFKQVLNSNG